VRQVAALDRAQQGRAPGVLPDEVPEPHRGENLTSTALTATLTFRHGDTRQAVVAHQSNVNDVIDSMQDPAKEIDQMVRDMEESARQARTEVAQCLRRRSGCRSA
jgi:hypothetical protein